MKRIPLLLAALFLLSGCNLLPLVMPAPTPGASVSPTAPFADATTGEPVSTETAALPPPAQFRLVAYYPYWMLSTHNYRVEDIPAASLTQINYAFAGLSDQGECVSVNANADATNLPALQALKGSFPRLQTLISVGGGGTNKSSDEGKQFSHAAASDESRARLIQSCIAFMQANGFDGIDLDWEYPQAGETQAFTALLTGLRQQLDALGQAGGRRYLLTIAAPAGPWQMARIDFQHITPLVDWYNLMTYDYYGSWSSSTGLNAPLYTSAADAQHLSVDATVQAYLAAGVPAARLVVGLPFYGHGWQGVADSNHGLYQPFSAPAQGTGNGSFDYYFIQDNLLGKFGRYWDDESKSPWLYDPTQAIMISYDDAQSLSLKAAYIRQHGLGGGMIWQIGGDDDKGTLLKAVVEGLEQ